MADCGVLDARYVGLAQDGGANVNDSHGDNGIATLVSLEQRRDLGFSRAPASRPVCKLHYKRLRQARLPVGAPTCS